MEHKARAHELVVEARKTANAIIGGDRKMIFYVGVSEVISKNTTTTRRTNHVIYRDQIMVVRKEDYHMVIDWCLPTNCFLSASRATRRGYGDGSWWAGGVS